MLVGRVRLSIHHLGATEPVSVIIAPVTCIFVRDVTYVSLPCQSGRHDGWRFGVHVVSINRSPGRISLRFAKARSNRRRNILGGTPMQQLLSNGMKYNARRVRSGEIRSIQALRAIAALFVVVYHTTILWQDKAGLPVRWENGNAGVDQFFVVSGFIMVYKSGRLRTKASSWHGFIVARLVRVVPMYWLTTAAKLVSIAAVPSLVLHTVTTPWNIVASFLFVPSLDGAGFMKPVLVVGWTLSFEMMFYVAFAAALLFTADPLVVVAPAMAALALLYTAHQADWPPAASLADPIVLEFVLGMIVGRLTLRGKLSRLPMAVAFAGLVVGLLCVALVPTSGSWQRVSIWGVASAITLTSVVRLDPWLGSRISAWIVLAGEASYSLYLTHTFALPVVGAALVRIGLRGYLLGGVMIPACIASTAILAIATYRWIETPLTRWLQNVTSGRQASKLADSETPLLRAKRMS